MFDFVIPVLQDYGTALKANDPCVFLNSFDKLVFLFLMCHDSGAALYQKTLFIYRMLLDYWVREGLPVFRLIRTCHAAFSEESGEIALGKMAQNLPANDAADISRCQAIWKLLKLYSKKTPESLESKLTRSRCLGNFLHVCVYFFFRYIGR